MQSDKKFRRETRPKALAHEFAVPYSNSVEDLKRAMANAQRFETLSLESAGRQTDRLQKKDSMHTANFWKQVYFELKKHEKSLKEVRK